MDPTLSILAIFTYLWNYVESVPPAACFANFRWDDCGYPPKAVLYYYKAGSRCEVGFWRGCLPNPNMFKDEYECVNTCIFTVRAQPHDYHNLNDEIIGNNEVLLGPNITDIESTTPDFEDDATNVATEEGEEGSGDATEAAGAAAEEGDAAAGGEDAPAAGGEDAPAAGGDEAPAEGGDAPAGGDEAPAEGGDAPAGGDEAPAAEKKKR